MNISPRSLAWSLMLISELLLFLVAFAGSGSFLCACVKRAAKLRVPLLPFALLCVPLALVTVLFFVAVKGYGTPNAMPFADVATAMMGGTVFPMMYSAIFLLRMDGLYGKMYVLLPFCVAFLGDSFAMYGGMLFGKRKMAPAVSPHKTWAGSVAGLIGSALGLVLWGVVARMWLGYEPNYLNLVLAGLVTNAIGQLGDLAMSLIKREAGVKDYSHIFLTHGGMLDRFDSTLFITPWIYLFVCAGML